jgi:hypothetical protein
MFFLFAATSWRPREATAAVSLDVDHDGHLLILIQIIAERPTLWEATELVDGGESAGSFDRKINGSPSPRESPC